MNIVSLIDLTTTEFHEESDGVFGFFIYRALLKISVILHKNLLYIFTVSSL